MSTIIRYALYAALALGAWFAILLAMPFVGPAGRRVAVVGDSGRAIRIVAEAGGQVVEIREGVVIAYARPASLYRAGAWLVIEGRIAAGCFQPVAGGAGRRGA